jgi:glycosyltransferase involved in cell wall biosynthesis
MSDTSPLVSIAMSTYNGEKYIHEQLDSLVNQSYSNIEIVIVDDHSTDQTVPIIKSYQNKYPFIKLFCKECNSGVNKTFEQAIAECKGEFIAPCDQDDIWFPEKITVLMNEISDEDAVYSNSFLIDENGESLQKDFNSIIKLRSYYTGAPFLNSNCVPGHTLLIKATFAKKTLPFPEHVIFDWWLSFCAASNNGIKYVDKCLVKYRQHDSNTVGLGKRLKKKDRPTVEEKFNTKLTRLKAFRSAPINCDSTRYILDKMILHFNRHWSFQRSIFFLKNHESILLMKNKPRYRKVLYGFKMFFKTNY